MPNGGRIDFQIGFKTDKSGINQLKQTLQTLQNSLNFQQSKNGLNSQLQQASKAAKEVQTILNEAWNNKLGQLNLDKVNAGIKKSFNSVTELRQAFNGAGADGRTAFNQLATEILHANTQIKEGNALLNDFADTFGKTVKYGIASSIFNNIKNSLQQAFYFAKDLDLSLTNIRIVTGDSADQMERFSKTANQAAKNLGRSTLDYTNAALTFYQQGLSDEEVNARTQATMMAQNITGTGTQMADYLTAVWNGYKAGAEEAVEYVDKLAAVADSSASDMSQLAIAMSKVASAANVMGVDSDQLNAQLATVIATTRQAPESIGTAFKTIYARLNDIKTGADGAEVSLGNYSGKLAQLGFNVFDVNGKLRDSGDVIEEIGNRWGELTREQQIYLAQVVGGTRQYSRLISLFDNWTMYTDMLNVSLNSQGTLLEKNSRYMDSVKAHMEQLNTETERTYQILSDPSAIKATTDVLTKTLTLFNDFIEGLGGGIPVLTYFGSVLVGVFSKQIAGAVDDSWQKITRTFSKKKMAEFLEDIRQNVLAQRKAAGDYDTVNEQASTVAAEKEVKIYERMLTVQKGLTGEQQKRYLQIQKEVGLKTNDLELLKQHRDIARDLTGNSEATSEIIKEQLQNEKEYLETLRQQRAETNNILNEYNKNGGMFTDYEQKQNTLQLIANLEKNSTLSVEQRNRLREVQTKLLQGEKLTQSDINIVIQAQNVKEQNQATVVQKIINLLKIKRRVSEGEIDNLEEEIKLLMQEEGILNKQGQHSMKMQKGVQLAASLGQVLSSAAGAAKVFWDTNSTGAEKANSLFSSLQGTISAVGFALGGKAFIFTSIITGVLELFRAIPGVKNAIEGLFTSSTEAMQKTRKVFQETQDSLKVNRKGWSELKSVEEEYETLVSKSGKLTSEEKSRLTQLAEKFAQYSDDVITGYDLQGQAIVNKNNHIKDGLKDLDTEYEKIQRNARAQLDLKGLDKDYNDAVAAEKDEWDARNLQSTVDTTFNSKLNNSFLSNFPNSLLSDNLIDRLDGVFIHVQEMYDEAIQNYDLEGLKNAQTYLKESLFGGENSVGVFSSSEDIEALASRTGLEFHKDWANEIKSLESNEDYQNFYNNLQGAVFDLIEDIQGNIEILQEFEDVKESLSDVSPEAVRRYIQGGDTFQNIRKSFSGQDWNDWAQSFWSDIITSLSTGLKKTAEMSETEDFGQEGQRVIQEISDNLLNTNLLKEILDQKDKEIQDIVKKQGFISIKDEADITKKYVQKYLEGINIDKVLKEINSDNNNSEVTKKAYQNLIKFFGLDISETDIEHSMTDMQKNVQAAVDKVSVKLKKSKTDYKELSDDDRARLIKELSGVGIDKFFALQTAIDNLDFSNIEIKDIESLIKQLDLLSQSADETGKSLSNLSIDDEIKFFKLLKEGKSYSKIEGADTFVNLLETRHSDLRSTAVSEKKGRRSDKWINDAIKERRKELEDQVINQKKLYDDAIKEIEKTSVPKDSLEYGSLIENIAILEDSWIAAKEALELFNSSLEENDQKTKTLLDTLKQQKDSFDEVKSAYEKMWSDSDLTDKENAAVDELATRYSQLAQAEAQHGKGSIEYLQVLKEVLALEEKRLKIKQGQVINIQNEIEKQQVLLRKSQQNKENATDPKMVEYFQKHAEEAREKIESLKSQLEELGVSEEDVAEIISMDLDGLKQKYTKTSDQVKTFGSYYTKLTEGIKLSKEEYGDLTELLTAIKTKYTDLGEVVDRVSQTWMSGTDQYATWVEELQNKLSSKYIEEAFEQVKTDLKLPVSIQIDDEFLSQWEATKEDIENFFKDDRELSIRIDDALNTDLQQMKGYFDQVYDAASKIGQNFIVAAQDIGLIEKVFPSITQGMNLLANGSYELNQQMVQQAMGVADAQINASAQAMMDKIQNDIDYHNAKADIYHKMSQLAYQMAGDEIMSQEQAHKKIRQYSDLTGQIVQLDKQKTVQYQQEGDDNLVQSTDAATDDMSDSFIEYYESSAQASAESTNAQIDHLAQLTAAAKAMQAGQDPSAMKVTSNMGFLGHLKKQARQQSGQIPNAVPHAQAFAPREVDTFNQSSTPFDNFSKEEWLRQAQQAGAREAQERQMVDILQGALSEVQGRANRVLHGLQNVAQGHGINDPKEQKQKKEKQPAKPSTEKYLQEEFDLYHDINIILSKIDRQLKNIQKDQQKLTGAKLVENYQQQLDLLNQQIAAQKEKIGLAEWEAASLQNVLASQGVAFNSDGTIANYMSALQAKENEVNSFISYYNSLSKEQQEAIKGVLDSVKSEYEDLKKNISKYDNLVNEMIPDLADQIKDELDKKVEINIAKFKMAVDIKINLSQLTRDYNNFVKTIKRQIRQDDILGNTAFAFDDLESYFLDGVANSTTAQANHIKQTIAQIYQINEKGMSDIYGQNKAQALKDLEEYRKNLQGDVQHISELINEIRQNVLKAIDQVEDGFKNREKYYNHISDLIDHDRKLVELIFGDKAYQKMDRLYRQQYSYDVKHLNGLYQEKSYWGERLKQEKAYQETLEFGSKAWYQVEARIQKYEEYYLDATSKLNSEFERAIQNIISKYQNGIKEIFSDLSNRFTGGLGFQFISKEWELVKREADMHLDNINKTYQIEKLQSQFQDALAKSKGNIKAQREITALMQNQLPILAKNDTLREHDVERVSKLLELQQKMAALQDARNNKTNLTLRRDSQGNYSYQYSSDADDVASKLQEIRDLKNEIYNLDLNQYQEDIDEWMALWSDWQQELSELSALNTEQREKKQAEINDRYTRMARQLLEDQEQDKVNLGKSTIIAMTKDYDSFMNPETGYLKSIYSGDETNVQTWLTNDKEEINRTLEQIKSRFSQASTNNYGVANEFFRKLEDELYQGNITAFNSMLNNNDNGMIPIWSNGMTQMMEKIAGQGGLEPIAREAITRIQEKMEEYRTQLEALGEAARVNTDIIGDGLNQDIALTEELNEKNDMLLRSYQGIFDDMASYWIPMLENFISKHDELKAAIDAITEAYRLQREEYERDIAAMEGMASYGNSGGNNDMFGNTAADFAPVNVGGGYADYGYADYGYADAGYYGGGSVSWDDVLRAYNLINSGEVGNDPVRQGNLQSYGIPAEAGLLAQQLVNMVYPTWDGGQGIDWETAKHALGFDTGGYTGQWNDEYGRWALLHKKELVLNAGDTQNMLQAIQLVRDLNNQMYDYKQALLNYQQMQYEMMIDAYRNRNNYLFSDGEQTPIEQNVYISADFPAVRDYREIELAFENLANRASQYLFSSGEY